MFDALARLADGNARRVGLFAIVFFVLAAAIGGGVASHLDPYGADDPATETVEAKERLHDAGLKIPAVFAIVRDAPVSAPASRARVEALERSVRQRPDVSSVTGYYDTHSPVFVSHDRRSSYFVVTLKTFDDKKWQETGADIADQLSSKPGVLVGGAAIAQEQVNKQVEKDLRMAEMLAFPLLFLLSFVFFRSLVASAAATDDRWPGDRRHLPDSARRQRVRLDLDLRPQPDHGAGAGAGDRLQPLHRLPLPRGDRQGRTGTGGDATRTGNSGTHRLLLLADRRRGARLAARLPPALPLLDGLGRRPRHPLRGADLADRAARGADPARHPGQRPLAALPTAPRRGRHAARRERLLVPPLALRHAPSGAGGDDQRCPADRHGHPLLRHQVRHRRPDRAADLGQRSSGLRRSQQRIPALSRNADLGRRRRRRAEGGRALRGASTAGAGRRRSQPATAPQGGRDGAAGDLEPPLRLRGQPDNGEADPRSATATRGDGAGRRRDRRLRRPAVEPRQPPADRARRSSSSRR